MWLEEMEKQKRLVAEERYLPAEKGLQQVKNMGGGREEALWIVLQISFHPICSDVL